MAWSGRKLKNFNLDTYINSGAFGWQTGKNITLTLRFHRDAGAHLRETPLATNQNLNEDDQGRLIVRATLPETKQLNWWILGFGDNVEVLEPASLREAISDQLYEATKLYQEK